MSCIHKFNDTKDFKGLIPNWYFDKLVIGTFNPSNDFHELNKANFFYQRKKNYFWDVFPLFYNSKPISKEDVNLQKSLLKVNKIGITDILTSINDANKNISNHIQLISTVKDDDLEKFKSFNWNTKNIINIIHENKVKEVCFTKLGLADQINVKENNHYAGGCCSCHSAHNGACTGARQNQTTHSNSLCNRNSFRRTGG